MAAVHRSSIEAAKAVNSLLKFSGEDQTALLEVIEDYFCHPGDSDTDSSEETDLEEQGASV